MRGRVRERGGGNRFSLPKRNRCVSNPSQANGGTASIRRYKDTLCAWESLYGNGGLVSHLTAAVFPALKDYPWVAVLASPSILRVTRRVKWWDKNRRNRVKGISEYTWRNICDAYTEDARINCDEREVYFTLAITRDNYLLLKWKQN